MALSDMQVFNEYVMPATLEILDQEIDKFNAASGGALVLSSEGMTGDYMRESFFATLAAANRRVDRYGPNNPVAATPLAELQHSSVKIAGGFGPMSYEPSQLTWLQRPTQQGIAAASQSFAALLLQDQLNTAITCLVAAIGNQAQLVNDVSGTSQVTYGAMNTAHAAFGDMSGMLVASVMTGAQAHNLIGQNLTNAERLFVGQNVTVVDILGKVAVITDAPALADGGVQRVLSLANSAAVVSGTTDVITNVQTNNGGERIVTTFQADYSFYVGLKGYSWDEVNGGRSPDNAALGTGTNWDRVGSFDKMTAGVMAVGLP